MFSNKEEYLEVIKSILSNVEGLCSYVEDLKEFEGIS